MNATDAHAVVDDGEATDGALALARRLAERGLEVARQRVVLRVVRHHAFDLDPELGEEREGVGDERSARRSLFVRAGLHECDPGVIVDRDVEVVVAGLSMVSWPLLATMHPPTTTVRDPAELLHVNVDQLAWMVTLVANDVAGDAVQTRQTRLNRPVFCIRSGWVLGLVVGPGFERSAQSRTRRVGCRRARCGGGGC